MATGAPLLPEGARLFHIGPPKTGTTALQEAGSQLRATLRGHGVCYPGRSRNHRLAVAAVLGRQTGWAEADGSRGRPPSLRHWYALLGELEAARGRRTWFGHEYAAHASPEVVARFAAELGPSAHVVITLRSYARMLPSMWQEHLKAAGGRGAFEPWLRSMLRSRKPEHRPRQERHDHAALVRRWAGVFGPERVTVVVLDRADHGFVFRAFEDLLGLPPGLLDAAVVPGAANRSLSVPEVELLRRLNRATRAGGLPWPSHERLVVHGAVARLLAAPPHADPLLLPEWAVPLANARAEATAAGILATGVRVVGDPANLAEPAAARGAVRDHRTVDAVPLDVAVEALAGLTAVASGHEADFVRTPEQVLRQLWRHAGEDWAAVREVGLGATVRVAGRRAAGASQEFLHAIRGWAASRNR